MVRSLHHHILVNVDTTPRPFSHGPRVSTCSSHDMAPVVSYALLSSQCYYLRDEDTWHKIDYTAKAHTWMKPLQRGKPTGIVEIPANWYDITT